MGGYGSGRWRRRSRYALVEECDVLSVRTVIPHVPTDKAAEPSPMSIRVTRHLYGVDLESPHTPCTVTQTLSIAWTPCRFGRHRLWLVCGCGARCAKLYSKLADRRLACRTCHGLRYRSQRLSSSARRDVRVTAIKCLLRWFDDDGPHRPRGMRRARFARLVDQADGYAELRELALAAGYPFAAWLR